LTNNNWQQSHSFWDNRIYGENLFYSDCKISLKEATKIANERVPGAVLRAELDEENGLFVYEVTISSLQGIFYELEVDVYTGQIVKLKAFSS